MKPKKLSILYSIAQHFHHDASDFIERFDILRNADLTKTGRIKNFVDLLMGCECALKSHAILGEIESPPIITYKKIRKASHNIEKLANLASYMSDRKDYDFLKINLKNTSVFIRYSLEAYDTFFPFFEEYSNARINYSATIGNYSWVSEVREHLISILEASNDEFTGLVESDINTIIQNEDEIRAFMNELHA